MTEGRTLVIDLALVGAEWTATSAQMPGFRVYGDDREAAEQAVRDELGPAVTVEFREVGAVSPF